ncbi:MAG: hypothetical protein WBW32_03180 [Luteibacter sp.]
MAHGALKVLLRRHRHGETVGRVELSLVADLERFAPPPLRFDHLRRAHAAYHRLTAMVLDERPTAAAAATALVALRTTLALPPRALCCSD